MDLNQPLYFNVVFFLKIFLRSKESLEDIFFTKCSKCPIPGSIQLTLFFMKSHPLDQGLPSFKNPKVASCVVEKDTAATISFGSLLHSYFGVFGCQENPTFPLFSKLFSIDFLEEKMDWFFIHSSINF